MMKDCTVMKLNIQDTREMMTLPNQEVRKSAYIHRIIQKKTGTIKSTHYLATSKVCFSYIPAGDETNDNNEEIGESDSEEEMEVDENSQIGKQKTVNCKCTLYIP